MFLGVKVVTSFHLHFLPMRILIVDDEAGIRKTTRIAIETAGHEAAEAANGARALKAIEDDQFDVVFLDLK